MSETTDITRARRRVKGTGELRAVFAIIIGAAACLAVISAVRLFSGETGMFPELLVPVLVIVGVIGNSLTARRYSEALEDLELAAKNAGRTDALSHPTAAAPSAVDRTTVRRSTEDS